MSQNVENIKPCYPLFEQDEYKAQWANKRANFEEGHSD